MTMARPTKSDGMHWDTREIRQEREDVWFAQNEARLIEEARLRREAEEKKRQSAEEEARRLAHWRKCPKCGGEMVPQEIEGIEVEKCATCEGIYFDRGELDQLLLAHGRHRRGFFRKLLGFGE
jgi:NADH pyrophosphatase NudC (nudix superfamily)